jgi:formyl-CoA transferase
VPAGVCATNEDVYHDIHMRQRGYIVGYGLPDTGYIEYDGLTTRLSATPGTIEPLAPLGADNDDVFLRLLGLPEPQYRALIEKGVIV